MSLCSSSFRIKEKNKSFVNNITQTTNDIINQKLRKSNTSNCIYSVSVTQTYKKTNELYKINEAPTKDSTGTYCHNR
jgi:hypothetical protein